MIRHLLPNPTSPKRVVILGASGFVGTALANHLNEQHFSLLAVSSSGLDLCHPEAVIALRQLIREDDTLVFISALTPDRGRDIRTLMRNLAMGEHVCTALRETPCSHVVYISSDAVYDDDINLIREESCSSPKSFHGLMHLARERMLSQTLQGTKTPLLVVRPSLLYGAADTHNSYGPNRFLRTAIDEGKVTLFGTGEEKRDHVYISDVARLIALCIKQRSEGVLNVATGTSMSFYEIANHIAAFLDRQLVIEYLPRSTPIIHRHFDIAATLSAFPSFRYTAWPAGAGETYQRMVERTHEVE